MALENLENMIQTTQGQARNAMRTAQEWTRQASVHVEPWVAEVRGFVRTYPLQILAATIGLGYILGKLTRR